MYRPVFIFRNYNYYPAKEHDYSSCLNLAVPITEKNKYRESGRKKKISASGHAKYILHFVFKKSTFIISGRSRPLIAPPDTNN